MNSSWKKNMILFLLSQTMSLFGSSLVQFAITWYITVNTKSGVMMAISIVCGFLPTFFLSPFAGVLADRYSRKILIVLSDSFIALSTLLMAILFFMGHDSVVLLFVLSVFRAIGTGIQTPSVNAFIPQLVPQDKLGKINGINSSIQGMTMLLSPMLSGVLLSIATIEVVFFVDVITAAIAVVVMSLFLKVPTHVKAQNTKAGSYLKDMREGIGYIRKSSYLSKFFIYYGLAYFFTAPVIFLAPLQVARSFGEDVWRLTAVQMALCFGMILGGITIASKGGFKNRIHTVIFASFMIGICSFLIGSEPVVLPIFWLYVILTVAIGIAVPLFNTPITILLQEKVDRNFQGRVFGVLSMISNSVMPLAMLAFGPIADTIRIEWLLMGTGSLIIIQGFFLTGRKEIIDAGRAKGRVIEG